MAGKNNRFQLFLYEHHDKVAAAADAAGRTLSAEVRQRVARSFWQDEVIEEIERMAASLSPGTDFYDEATIEHLRDFIAEARKRHHIPRPENPHAT